MDTLAHGLWVFGIFHRKKYAMLATLYGILPDLLSFGIVLLGSILSNNFQRGPPPISSLPGWLFVSYNLTHSLIVFGLVFVVIYLITKRWY